ncbi:antibiotic biosynthesis monooxygenase [Formosa sediminum]|uniref:Antibiotic biosynthesis monooxygenase n=1 Tax=Formosa sediminum TaxID=2594004 RepID=A0A516GV76_9FLAO|nr:antibiotic biosynthesis monooxygenase family protein [Formosa sediminum]QDO95428.1 antibiotic biosynthesis monooxygenase [Formosa sediminum]
MFVRIVKLSFKPTKVDDFITIFETNKTYIRNFEGCMFLELYRDKTHSNIFFTYSYWSDEAALNTYRHSNLFTSVWTETKQLFNNKPEAWSVDKLVSLP